jgi:N,N'-diacetyllegionaminate synthase
MRRDISAFSGVAEKSFFVIAEIGINHNGSLDDAMQLIDSAHRTGVDSVKFQTYLTEKRVPRESPIYDILKKCELPLDSFGHLKTYAESLGLKFFSTPFDCESLECLESLGCDLYKVASFDVKNHKLLQHIADTGKAAILSVGMSTMDEVRQAYSIFGNRARNLAILHCISSYPTCEKEAQLGVIPKLLSEFDCVIGQSDHTNGIYVPLCAAAAGAQVLEKHYKLTDNHECVDSPVSITETQMTELVKELSRLECVFGEGQMGVRDSEKGTVQFREYRVSNLE